MKKVSLFFAYLAVICIAFFALFKFQHWPGANVLCQAGCVLFCLGFLPLWFLQRYKMADTTIKKLISLFAFLAMFLLVAALLVKVMKWCPGIALACAGYSFLILTIILSVYQAFKESDPWKSLFGHTFAIATAIALTIFVFIELSTIPKSIFKEFTVTMGTQDQEIQYFTEKSSSIFANFDPLAAGNPLAQSYYEKAQQVNAVTDSLVVYLKSLGETLMFQADDEVIPWDSIHNLKNAANTKVARAFFCQAANDSLCTLQYDAFKSFMAENTNSRGKEILDTFFPEMTQDSAATCSMEDCCHWTVAGTLIWLNSEILHARILQAETMNYLQTMQAKAINRTVAEPEKSGE